MEKSRTLTPGRWSGVASGGRLASMPASHLQPMTDVANPVIDWAAAMAHSAVSAVITTRAPHMAKASAKVSAISVSRMRNGAMA